jgi:hypothetical protein
MSGWCHGTKSLRAIDKSVSQEPSDLPRRGVLQQSTGGRQLLMPFVVTVVRPGQKIAIPMARHRPIFNRRRMRRSIGGPNHRRMRRTL